MNARIESLLSARLFQVLFQQAVGADFAQGVMAVFHRSGVIDPGVLRVLHQPSPRAVEVFVELQDEVGALNVLEVGKDAVPAEHGQPQGRQADGSPI